MSERKFLFVDPTGLTDEEVAARLIEFLDAEAPLPDEDEADEADEADAD